MRCVHSALDIPIADDGLSIILLDALEGNVIHVVINRYESSLASILPQLI